ncbi:DNA-protecting protein DprA [Microbacterium schleiferi]|uniref:DNA-protecting protein DprA n=1 Tax=Microbacterium schleiferi TaxID=69362 RepID=A0A7S8MW80_9MICO|nr:DNA-processing protein DprA [Microbacterium schleiferi]QPE03510.1 DNA-protecting protein DprA [Microbacterium schleiferi]
MIDPQRARDELGPLVAGVLSDDDVVERYARVVWNTLTEPGDGAAGILTAAQGPVEALARVRRGELSDSVLERGEARLALERWEPRMRPGAVSAVLRTARAARLHLVTPADEAWPDAADDLGPHAPLVLWVRGDPRALEAARSGVAIVGARAATAYGEHVAGEFAAELAASGVCVVSGAAFGIDAAAHRASLAGGGCTVALMAGGLERAYPQAHTELVERIAATGAVVSEVAPGSAPTKWRFLQRNRLIAALSAATVVVEAGWRSGSLNTAHHASALGRPLGAVPGPVTSAASAGCHRLLRELEATCVTTAAEVRELIGWGELTGRGGGESAPRTTDATRVRDALSRRVARSAQEVARRSGLGVADVQSHLGLLHLDGLVTAESEGWRLT